LAQLLLLKYEIKAAQGFWGTPTFTGIAMCFLPDCRPLPCRECVF
jgi:hypothetical protein